MREKKRKILLISKNFPPSTGGIEKLAWKLYQLLAKEFICDVIAPNGARDYVDTTTSRVYTCPLSPLPLFLVAARNKAMLLTATEKYDLCIGCSGLTAPILFSLQQKRNIPCITLVHGLDIIANSFLYQHFFVPKICRCNVIIANSQNTANLTFNKCRASNITVINPGVDLPDPHKQIMSSFRKEYKLMNKKILLTVGRIIPRKGIAEFIRFCMPEIVAKFPDIIYCIVGEQPANAINRTGNTLAAINSSIAEMNLEHNVMLTGKLENELLQSAYSESDLFIFPVLERSNDMEGFGMVAIEAAARGLPTIAFASGGIPDAISSQSGVLIQSGNHANMTRAILDYLEGHNTGINRESCIEHAEKFSWNNYGKKFISECMKTVRTD